MKKIGAWILTVLAYVLGGLCVAAIVGGERAVLFVVCLGAAFFAFGTIAHIMLEDSRGDSKISLVFWIISFLPYIIVFLVRALIKALSNTNVGSSGSTPEKEEQKEQYVVTDEHYCERTLTFFERALDSHMDSTMYGEYYSRFRDDVGNFWRSYDGNETFIKETREMNLYGYHGD